MSTPTRSQKKVYTLPPLILHPFADASGPGKLVESSKASLMLQGLLPGGPWTTDELEQKLLEGRYCEIRMLFYLGKDVARWLEQCLEFVTLDEELRLQRFRIQSFAAFLVHHPPQTVREKLRKWGVVDHKAIFSRAIGIHSLFADMPEREQLSVGFIRDYYRYADHLFTAAQSLASFAELDPRSFHFDLYASGEYSRLLAREWERS